jgi:hypothetical protein
MTHPVWDSARLRRAEEYRSPTVALLPRAEREIHLFGDGSYQSLISFGSWAFFTPTLGLQGAETEAGPAVDTLRSRLFSLDSTL